MKTTFFLTSTLVLSLVTGCGESTPAKSPESNVGVTETSSTKEDMPPPPAKDSTETTAAPPTDTSAPAVASNAGGAPGGVIKLAAMKLTPMKKGKDKAVELKDDGSVSIDGKPAAKIKGDQVDSTGGTSMVTVGVDGSLVGNGVKPGYKFEGDDLVHESGVKLSVADDGKVTVTKDGKTETLVKTEGGATTAKRAALIATVLWMTVPTGNAKAAAVNAGGKNTPAAKAADKK